MSRVNPSPLSDACSSESGVATALHDEPIWDGPKFEAEADEAESVVIGAHDEVVDAIGALWDQISALRGPVVEILDEAFTPDSLDILFLDLPARFSGCGWGDLVDEEIGSGDETCEGVTSIYFRQATSVPLLGAEQERTAGADTRPFARAGTAIVPACCYRLACDVGGTTRNAGGRRAQRRRRAAMTHARGR